MPHAAAARDEFHAKFGGDVSIDVGTSEWYKALIRGGDKYLILLVEEPWTDNPFLGTIVLLSL